MIKYCFGLLALFITSGLLKAQTKVYTTDIDHFYEALDSVHLLSDPIAQLNLVDRLYVGRASDGLKNFIRLGGGSSDKWLFNMIHHRTYYQEIRPYCARLSDQIPEIERRLEKLKSDFPAYRNGNIYFIMGIGLTGGTPDYETGNLLLCADNLARTSSDWAIPSAIHEFIHIQQKRSNGNLLAQTITEGMAEFLSEVYYGKSLAENGFSPHLVFGMRHEKSIWKAFQKDMFLVHAGYEGWLYDGFKRIKTHFELDLGYFVGYQICRSFYERTPDPVQAVRQMLELDLSSDQAVLDFVRRSGYASEKEMKAWQNRGFTEKKTDTSAKKKAYGYKIKNDKVTFAFWFPAGFLARHHIPVVRVSVAGTFNNWNPEAEGYAMVEDETGRFSIELPMSALGDEAQFKFVVNGFIWLPVPEFASNRNQEGNLVFTRKQAP